jgi:hypothetical protein
MTSRIARPSARAKHFRALVLVMFLSCATAAVAGCNGSPDFIADAYLVNQARASVGAPQLGWSPALATKAANWAQHLADTGVLAHSVLSDGVPPGWHSIGENVGYAESVTTVHSSFLNSAEHRANMLNRGWRVMGIGVVRARGVVWVAEVYES